ncbi:uncharacterized protein LOC131634106 [Vicia villosa]|uniref:uncharacterized protein LOC131634106 n=1 Tax=Vicia villosa TaxID=3911 RepID=UPI00273B0957|nr:uncharacterized protein LOC131634106 [Vicia villosa]
MRNATDYGGFQGFQLNQQTHFELLQFADDTVMLYDGSLDNLWCVKAFLRGFKRIFGLRININKSKIYGINIGEDMLTTAANFLPCEIGRLPFLFLGLPVGANHRRKDTWKPVFKKLSRRLATWQGKHVSLGGKVTLLNSVLNNIPIYWLSFFKAPRVVWEV